MDVATIDPPDALAPDLGAIARGIEARDRAGKARVVRLVMAVIDADPATLPADVRAARAAVASEGD
jgi:hypothetical protein